jgi:uncharacterized protein (TIGR03435 family)
MQMGSSDVTRSGDEVREMWSRLRRQLFGQLGADVWIGGISASPTVKELCEAIESGLDRPLVDETNLTGTYAINIHTELMTAADFLRSLCNKLGLVLTPGQRDVQTLVIRAE